MTEKCRSNQGKAKRLGVDLLHLVFCTRAPKRVSVTKVLRMPGAEVKTWGNLSSAAAACLVGCVGSVLRSEVEASTT